MKGYEDIGARGDTLVFLGRPAWQARQEHRASLDLRVRADCQGWLVPVAVLAKLGPSVLQVLIFFIIIPSHVCSRASRLGVSENGNTVLDQNKKVCWRF